MHGEAFINLSCQGKQICGKTNLVTLHSVLQKWSFSIVIIVTILKCVSPMCQISLMQFTSALVGVCCLLRFMSWSSHSIPCCFMHPQPSCWIDHCEREGRTEYETDWWVGSVSQADRHTDFSCVIYVKRALACFCPRQHSSFSRDLLSLPWPARHHRVEKNEGFPGRVQAASLKS